MALPTRTPGRMATPLGGGEGAQPLQNTLQRGAAIAMRHPMGHPDVIGAGAQGEGRLGSLMGLRSLMQRGAR